MRFILLLLGFSLVTSLPARAEKPEAAYSNLDAIKDLGPNKSGVQLLRKLTSTQSATLQNISYSPSAKRVFELANDTVKNLDFDRLLDSSYGVRIKGGRVVYPFQSAIQSGKYRINFAKQTIADLQIRNFFDNIFQFSIKENPSLKTDPERGYGVTVEGAMIVDEFDHEFANRMAKNQLLILDPTNLRAMRVPDAKVFDKLSGLARVYISDLARTLPITVDVLDALVEPEIIFTTVTNSMGDHLDVVVRLRLRLESIKEKYPNLGEHIESMGQDLFFVSSSILRTEDNLTIFRGGLNLAENKLEFRFRTSRGLIIPMTREGQPVASRAIDFENLRAFKGRITTGFKAKVYGLSIENNGIESSFEYHDGKTAVIRSKLLKVPTAKFSGGLFGVLPPGFLDIMMPGNLEGYSKKFADGLVRGNAGRGSFAEVQFASNDKKRGQMSWIVSAEVKDDFFLNIGLRILNDYLWPSDETIRDMQKLSSTLAVSLDRDVQKLGAGSGSGLQKTLVSN